RSRRSRARLGLDDRSEAVETEKEEEKLRARSYAEGDARDEAPQTRAKLLRRAKRPRTASRATCARRAHPRHVGRAPRGRGPPQSSRTSPRGGPPHATGPRP